MRRFLVSALAICSLGSLNAADYAIPAPMAMPDEGAYAVAVLPDLLTTLSRVEALMELFTPGQVKPGQLKMGLGAMLGDMDLANFAGKPIVVVVGPGAPTPSFAIIIPAKNPQLYLDAGVNFGMLLGKAEGGLAIMTQTPDGEILGEKIAKVYPALTQALPKGDIRLLVSPDKLVAAYGGMLGMMAQMAAAQGGQPEAAKILGLEVAGLMAMAADVASVQMDFTLDPAGSVGEEITVNAKPGTALAKALVAPAPTNGQRAAARLSNEPSLMGMSGRVNWNAWSQYASKLMGDLKAKPEAAGIITDELIKATGDWGAGLSGDFAFTMRSVEGAPLPFQWEGLYACADVAKAEASILSLVGQMSGDSALGKLYNDMGVTMEFAKAARTSPSGVAVHKMSANIDPAKVPPEQVNQMKMMSSYELAVTKGWVVMAQESIALDALIAGTGKGMTVQADKTLGAERQAYFDLDLLGFMKAAMKMAGTGMEGMIPASKPGNAMSGAMTSGEGKALLELRIPLAPFADMTKAFGGGGGGRGGRGGANKAPPPDQNPAF